jgi:uncharacterized protein YkwD
LAERRPARADPSTATSLLEAHDVRRSFALALTAVSLTLLPFAPATADSGSDAAFVSRTNSSRAGYGLPALSVASDLASIARQHAARMAASRAIFHNQSLTSQVCCWTDLGENVGAGSTVDAIHQAFMASPEHRANILSSRYTQIGVGTARGSDGRLYVDEVFRRPDGTGPVTAAPPPTFTGAAPSALPQHASRGALRAPYVVLPSAHDLLLRRVHAVWLAKVHRHAERFDPLRRSLDYFGVMRQLTG